jgi:hypothetical protein
MTVGLPGTGIGGIFYLLLAVCMPIREFIRTLKGRTNLRRWGFITLQLSFVFGVVAAMWSEVWLVNIMLIWTWGTLKVNGPLLMAGSSFSDTKVLAFASAYMSFISLAFVITAMHVLRLIVRWSHRGEHSARPIPKGRPAFPILRQPVSTRLRVRRGGPVLTPSAT